MDDLYEVGYFQSNLQETIAIGIVAIVIWFVLKGILAACTRWDQ